MVYSYSIILKSIVRSSYTGRTHGVQLLHIMLIKRQKQARQQKQNSHDTGRYNTSI